MIAGSLVLAAYAVGWCLIALIQTRAENTIAPGGGLQPRTGAIMMTSAEQLVGDRLPDKRLPLDSPSNGAPACKRWEREPRSEVATGRPELSVSGHTTSHRRATVPSEGESHSRFGVGRRAGVGTHRVSRVPVRMAQPARRRGGSHRMHPAPYAPFRARFGVRGDVVESCRHTPPMDTSNAVSGVAIAGLPTVDTSPPLPRPDTCPA